MKRKYLYLFTIALFTSIFFIVNGCKKDSTEDKNNTTTADDKTVITEHNNDENDVMTANEDVDADINNIFSANKSGINICDATIDNKFIQSKTITINFNGKTNCHNPLKVRTGKIIVQLTNKNHWYEAGAVLTITFNNFKIANKLDTTKYIIFNGTKTYTNVSGISPLLTSIEQTVTSNNMKATFPNGKERTWNIARRKIRSVQSDSSIIYTITGIGNTGNYSNLEAWGTNRNGNEFFTEVKEPITITNSCHKVTSGKIIHYVNNKTVYVTFGLDKDGKPLTSVPDQCVYYSKIEWTGSNNATNSFLLAY
jgi:hypothetical protein